MSIDQIIEKYGDDEEVIRIIQHNEKEDEPRRKES